MKRYIISDNNLTIFDSFDWSCFAIDTETTSLRQDELELTGISLCDGKHNIYIPIGKDYNKVPKITSRVTKDSKVIMHNSSFDLRVLKKFGIDLYKCKLFDTMVASHLIDENGSKSLKKLTREILDREVQEYEEGLSHYTQRFYDYALDDSRNTYDLYEHFLPTIAGDNKLNRLFFQIEMPFQKVIAQMETNGVDIDLEKFKEMRDKVEQEVLHLETLMLKELDLDYSLEIDLYGKPIGTTASTNFNSSKQLIDIFNTLGLEITEQTPSGNPSVGKLTLLKHKEHPFVSLLIKSKVATKLRSAFLEPLPEHIQADGKIRPSFNDCGARTGRLSCSKPNLQQLPKARKDYSPANFRELFVAPDGYKMIAVDYSGQEVAVAAQVSKDPTLVESLRNGYDMHLAIANQFYDLGIPKEALSKDHEDYERYKDEHGEVRTKAKTITFGLLFGKGAYGFSKDFGISEDEAQEIVDKYFEGMPMLKQAIDDSHEELKKDGFIRNLAGRYRHFVANEQGYYPNGAFRQAFNFKIQGFAADMIRAAMVNTWYRSLKFKHWDLKPIMTVHDEAVYIVKQEYAHEASLMIKQAFEDVCKKFIVPVVADVSIGDNYSEIK